ncbi:MAG: sigma 54-interacting transcriptional regulator [Bacteriovoracia bacterium]
MRASVDLVALAARTSGTVLITGPTGSGKTRLARKIHEQGPRKAKPFVTVNLATMHEGTLESELFGHERGAFTGADQRRTGRLEMANGGTVFLDEIGELTPRLQARLLDFLQSRVVMPLGSNRELKLDVRVIAATHRDLATEARRGNFREDLFHRLRVITLELKSLAARPDEFDAIVHACLSEISREQGKAIRRITEELAGSLERHGWPGNVRELRNVLEFAVSAAEGEEIGIEHLPPWFFLGGSGAVSGGRTAAEAPAAVCWMEVPMTMDYYETIARFEKQYLATMLERFRGRINLTARQIGMNKTTLLRRVRQHDLHLA